MEEEVVIYHRSGRVTRLRGNDASRVIEAIGKVVTHSSFTFSGSEVLQQPLVKKTEIRGRYSVTQNGKHCVVTEDGKSHHMGVFVPDGVLPPTTNDQGPLFDFRITVEAFPVGEKGT